MKKIITIVFLVVFVCFSSYAKVLKEIGYVGKVYGIAVKRFKIEGESFKVGSTITVEYDLQNINKKPVKFNRQGAFIACRDPYYHNRDFAHKYENYTIWVNRTIHIKGTIKINKKGVWTFWPEFSVLHWGKSPSHWRAIKLKTKAEAKVPQRHSNHSRNPKHHKKKKQNHKKLVIKPPFITCGGWKISPGLAQTQYYCNPNTGYIGIFDSSLIGGAASYAIQYVQFKSLKNQRVKVRATFYYTGGTKTAGIAAFAGLQVMRIYNNKQSRRDINAGLNYQIAVNKIIDIALIGIPGTTQVEDVKEALEIIDTIRGVSTLLNELKDLYNAGKAKRYVYTFYIYARKGMNVIALGLRGNCSGIVTGSSFVVVAAQLAEVEISF